MRKMHKIKAWCASKQDYAGRMPTLCPMLAFTREPEGLNAATQPALPGSKADLDDKGQHSNHLALLVGLVDDFLDVQVLLAHRLLLGQGEAAQPGAQIAEQRALPRFVLNVLAGQQNADIPACMGANTSQLHEGACLSLSISCTGTVPGQRGE